MTGHAEVARGCCRLEGAVELERFLVACHGSVPDAVKRLEDHMAWRNAFLFLSPGQLGQEWGAYLHWHGRDVANRPILVVHLGKAAYNLARNERAGFVQALGKISGTSLWSQTTQSHPLPPPPLPSLPNGARHR